MDIKCLGILPQKSTILIMMSFVSTCLAHQLGIRSVGQFVQRQYERCNVHNGCTRIVQKQENCFSYWKCPQGELDDAVIAAIRYVRYQRHRKINYNHEMLPKVESTNQCIRLPSPVFQFDAPIEKNFSVHGVCINDMDVLTQSFQVTNYMSSFALRCILVAFFCKKNFLFAVYVNVNTGKIAPNFEDVTQSMSFLGESRYPYLTMEECMKQDEACTNLFAPTLYEVKEARLESILESCRPKENKISCKQIETNDVEVSIDNL